MKFIELLAPARDLSCGMAAVDHGADAVYIGALRFGARVAAGNSMEDISALCAYAHRFGVRVYVTLNTILHDEELEEARRMIYELHRTGVDALITQDLSLLQMELPPIALHASTQMDNRTPEQVEKLSRMGFRQAVLARELSLREIETIHRAVPDVTLEAFVHGALCVSYSGRCYASQYCFGRSANRGACAQFCRLPFTLTDRDGHTLLPEAHLLSLRDMNRSSSLWEMMQAGVRSFKIEGRLKNVSYVKNVTAHYRRELDRIMKEHPGYARSSWGREEISFVPDVHKSFARGFTDYFLHGRTRDMASPDTPKSKGEYVGYVKEVRHNCLIIAGTACFRNGDGVCFSGPDGTLQGLRVNRAEGNHLYCNRPVQAAPRTPVYRNYDQEWETLMSKPTATRRMGLAWTLEETDEGFRLTALREDGTCRRRDFPMERQTARTAQDDVMTDILSKLGDTLYYTTRVRISTHEPRFIPRSQLAEWRRTLVEELDRTPVIRREVAASGHVSRPVEFPARVDWTQNVSNRMAFTYCAEHGAQDISYALEHPRGPKSGKLCLMTCRYCIRYQWGWCRKEKGHNAPEPWYLVANDGRRFRLEFDCARCQMKVWSE